MKSNGESKITLEIVCTFEARGTLKQNDYQLWLRLHSPYIVWIPQVPVLSVEHEDKRDLISRIAIFTAIRQDPLPSKVVQSIGKNLSVEFLFTLGVRNEEA